MADQNVRITLTETLRYRNEIIAVQPDHMCDDQFDEIINMAMRRTQYGDTDDFVYFLETTGIEVKSKMNNFPESPESCEIEVDDIQNV